MASLIEKLTAEGEGEPASFLNSIVAQLWPNINVAGCQMLKEIVEPMFKTMLPGPLASLHFTKLDLGPIPLVLSNVLVTKTENDGIKLDLNVDWEGQCDFELDGNMIPKLGVKQVKMKGRLSILLCPLTNVIPLIGAAQIAFINPPSFELNFTGLAEFADSDLIEGAVHKVLLGVINSIVVLPNRIMVRLDAKADYFATFHQPLGVLRVTADKAYGFAQEAKSGAKKFFAKITKAAPDCYVEVQVGAEPAWRTSVKSNTYSPAWGETHDFVVTDYDQCIKLTMADHDFNGDDQVGIAVTTVREILMSGGKQELTMIHKGHDIPGKIAISCDFFEFTTEDNGSFSSSSHSADGLMSGVIAVLIAGAYDIEGPRKTLQPSVKVTMGTRHSFRTAIKTDAPGTDINNPTFDQNFRIPLTPADLSGENLRIAILDKDKEVGAVEIPFSDLQKAPNMILQNSFDVGNGAKVRASISLKGLKEASLQEMSLPTRGK